MAGCGAFTADASRCASRRLSTPHAGPCAALPPSCRACDADLVRGGGAALRAVSAARLFYGCTGASTEGDARAIDLSAVPLPRLPVALGQRLLVYVSFGKVGSTTMRHKLDLGVYLKLLRWRKLHAASCDCDAAALSRIDVVQGKLGTCEYFGVACTYFTILREPVSRTLSGYNYWCLGGAEGYHRRRHKGNHSTHCPNITLEEWARRMGNVYVDEFSRRRAFGRPSEFTRCGAPADGCAAPAARRPLDVASEELAVARVNLRQHVLVVTTEELQTAGWRVLARALGWDMLTLSHPKLAKFWKGNTNTWGPRHAPSAAERARVAEILAPDVALYRDAQRLWQTYKDAFGGGNATVPEGAAGRRAGRRAERRAAQQMLRQRRRGVGEG